MKRVDVGRRYSNGIIMAVATVRIYGVAASGQPIGTLQDGCRGQPLQRSSISRWQVDIRRHYAISELLMRRPSLVRRDLSSAPDSFLVRQSGKTDRRHLICVKLVVGKQESRPHQLNNNLRSPICDNALLPAAVRR